MAIGKLTSRCKLNYAYKGEAMVIPAVNADFCPACGESITQMAKTDRVMGAMQAFNRQVNAAIVDPAFIVHVRKKLRLGRREAAEILGAASTHSLATKTARPSRRWPW